VRENTLRDYRVDLERWWLSEFGACRLRAITAPMITRYLAKLGAREVPYIADKTLRRLFAPMSALMAVAVHEGLIEHNICRDVKVPSGRDRLRQFEGGDPEDDDQAVKVYTRSQIRQLLAALSSQETLHLLAHTLAVTGLRISEALPLRWQDVVLDGAEPHVKVRRAWVRQQMGPPKSRYGKRQVQIPRALVDELRQQQGRLDPRQELVFPSDTGTVRLAENVRRRLLPFAQEAGVEWIGFHAFRHAFASALIEDGRSIVQVSRLLGHHSPAFTLAVYSHLMDSGTGGPLELDLTAAPAALQAVGQDPGLSREPVAAIA
jgi:integrase